jgi:hypothetical protein
MFADALNHRFEPNEPRRLQERPNAELAGREEPEYGRRYKIFTKSEKNRRSSSVIRSSVPFRNEDGV